MILGNIEGVKNSILNELDNIYNFFVPKDSIFTDEIVSLLCKVSNLIEREVSVSINRKGKVISVAIGDSSTVELPLVDVYQNKLSGVRVIHTHPNGNPKLSAVDTSALLKLKLDCIVAIGTFNNLVTGVCIGFCDVKDDILTFEEVGPLKLEDAIEYKYLNKLTYTEEIISNIENLNEDDKERAILVGIDTDESLEELGELARACNVEPVMKVMQKKDKIDNAFFIGKGKVSEIALLRQVKMANVIIFDDELAGSQVRNLEDSIGTKVIDRTTLILDIFARRAKSKEAKIQVELAQLKYRLPRLMGLGSVLSRTGGGIGTRGPGEKKLEVDKRHIRDRIHDLENELKKAKKTREVQREKRVSSELPQISLVGYTNAGKSTLRNLLCELLTPRDYAAKEKVFEANMLFATLDVTTRAIKLTDNRTAALTDTVGFVRKLPHSLVESFKSTLEEVIYSDLLVHVVDSSSDTAIDQIKAVNEVLTELNAKDKNTIIVLNKIDKAENEKIEALVKFCEGYEVVQISAKEKINIDKLLSEIEDKLPSKTKKVEYLIPYDAQKVTAYIHQYSVVELEEFKDNGTYLKAIVDEKVYNKCREYMIGE
ncbi:GTPase HflX [Clostridium hydrogenum]|uniref:GTPase HflX n=1 Tax=Clostridium hydrogenum TaxID=2855764 RepID=UPI001F4872CF|nr:GTPase HflX [Clostridium hydrogenum]